MVSSFESTTTALLASYDAGRRWHPPHQFKSLDNLTPADVYLGRGQTILLERERIKRDTIKQRRLNHQAKAA